MHYAAQLSTAYTSPTAKRAFSISSYSPTPDSRTNPKPVRRITINVGGERFQTYEETLARYPSSLLGSPERRREYYDLTREELVFQNRDKDVFNAILFFYQAKILSRPQHVPLEIFAEEIDFFELTSYSDECIATEEKTLRAFPENTENSLRCRLWNFLENPTLKCGRAFAMLNQFLLFVWIILLCVETQIESDDICEKKREWSCWFIMDTVFVLWFTIDYLLHILTAPHLVRYICSPDGLVDLVTVLPYYLKLLTKQLGAGVLSPWFEALRFMMIFRVFKASRRSIAFRILVETLASSVRDFPVWILLLVMHIFCFSSILYFIEKDVGNPQFSTIPDVMWFTVITMCAIGYGDVIPQSILGKFVTAIAAVSGIIIVYCLPAPTLKSNFIRVNQLYKSRKKLRKSASKKGVQSVNLSTAFPCFSRSQYPLIQQPNLQSF